MLISLHHSTPFLTIFLLNVICYEAFKLMDLVGELTRVIINSSLQIDVLLTTDIQCFESTGVFPFGGSDHYIIISYFYARGICVDLQPHKFVVARNFQKLDTNKLHVLSQLR